MELKIVNPNQKYALPAFRPPPASGWLYLAASIAPPRRAPFVRRHPRRAAVLADLKQLAAAVRKLPEVNETSVFRAVLLPPLESGSARPARFDVTVLIETSTPDAIAEVRAAPPLTEMLDVLQSASSGDVCVMAARCTRLLGPVDHSRQGLFLFNHFAPDTVGGERDLPAAIGLWEHLAAWYVAETGLSNSALLTPVEAGDYLFVNHARWDTSLPRLAVAQFGKRSFRSYVRANLAANDITAMPVLYRLA